MSGSLAQDAGDRSLAGFSGISDGVQKLHPASWNLDRLDQRDVPLDGTYRSGVQGGGGVTIYNLDSGLSISHQEFMPWTGGFSRATHGYNFVEDLPIAVDCDGHGTHVASTAAGRTVGVAKAARVVGVRVLDCRGSGTVSDTVAGLDWVARNLSGPAVVTMSLGIGEGLNSKALTAAVKGMIELHNVTVVVASGNSNVDSCLIVPANVEEAITVAASDLGSKFNRSSQAPGREGIYSYSNTGACVDIFAPGVNIAAACGSTNRCKVLNDSAYTWASGTSMAVPHVAGVAALYLSEHPTASPAEVKQAILGSATPDALATEQLRSGTPNLLLYSVMSPGVVQAADGTGG